MDHLLLFTCTSLVSFSTTKLSKFACGWSREERRGRKWGQTVQELQCKLYAHGEKQKQKHHHKRKSRFSKPVLPVATKQGLSSSGNNCQPTLGPSKEQWQFALKWRTCFTPSISSASEMPILPPFHHPVITAGLHEKVQWESQVFEFLLLCWFVEEICKSLCCIHTGKNRSNTRWRQSKNYCCNEAACRVWLEENWPKKK